MNSHRKSTFHSPASFDRKALAGLAAMIATFAAGTDTASAQVNCGVLPHGPARASCYGRESQIYREQSQQYYGIAQQQYRVHQNVGNAIRHVPIVGHYAAPAWNAPRYYYNYRYGRP